MICNFEYIRPLEPRFIPDSDFSFDAQIQSQIQQLLSNFWYCPEMLSGCVPGQTDFNELSCSLVIKQQNRIIKARKKNKLLRSRNTKQSLECLELLLKNLWDNGQLVIKRANKSKTKPITSTSTRRSSYIGVSKNGDVWQSLIMIDSKKTYIGSFKTEDEAAMSYDFYAIMMKHFSAKTNFDYTLHQIQKMVENYKDNNYEFIPSYLF